MSQVSIIIPALNEEKFIGGVLGDIFNQTRKPDEVIVVDGDSNDATVSVARKFEGVKILTHSPSIPLQRNFGAEHALGDVLLFMDADVHLPPRFIEQVSHDFERRRLDIACPLYMPYQGTKRSRAIYFLYNFALVTFQKLVPAGAGMCLMVRREVFSSLNGFDKRFLFDDLEFIGRGARKYKFGMMYHKILVSDRRFRKYGTARMFMRYLLLTCLHTARLHHLANRIPYRFGEYDLNIKDKPQQ